MGTRNLTAVRLGKKLRVAQYGQWDGYPTGQGITIAEFVQCYLLDPTLRAEFADKVATIKAATKAQQKKIDKEWAANEAEIAKDEKEGNYLPAYKRTAFDWYSRDTGAKILRMVNNASEVPPLVLSPEFLEDTLFCEWAYIIDLDRNVVEVYAGTKEPVETYTFANFTIMAMRTLQDRDLKE